MEICEASLDDIMYTAISNILNSGVDVDSSKGKNKEIQGVKIVLSNIRARVSRSFTKKKVISPIGELLWYLSGSNKLDFIEYYISRYADYSDDGSTLNGAYGAQLFNGGFGNPNNQFNRIHSLLADTPNTRQAFIPILNSDNLSNYNTKDLPCTIGLQFFVRREALDLYVFMRSNDVFRGLPHDLFCFTMIQELMASLLKLKTGEYVHFASSLHLYNNDFDNAKMYVNEGYQSLKSASMPNMPILDKAELQSDLESLLACEALFRTEKSVNDLLFSLPKNKYWADLVELLRCYKCMKEKKDLKSFDLNCIDPFFHSYIKSKM